MTKNAMSPTKSASDWIILPLQNSDLQKYLDEGLQLAVDFPGILSRIEADLHRHAIKEKQRRLAQRRYEEGRISDLPGMGPLGGTPQF